MVSYTVETVEVGKRPEYAIDYPRISVEVPIEPVTENVSVSTTPSPYDISGYRVVIISNPSNVKAYLSTYSDGSNKVTIDPGSIIGIGLELARITDTIYLWADSPITLEVIKIR